ncbi:nucleotide sugar dehydrogenase [Citroniella saccharovorans]|uniref:Nucleotide sugar dehydrogenase n=1 Tax=Citroniella saccharovorans TaxID=2053367 RepID=A0AAW9MYI9_9FIRM|nr:nucleotide sugar dehydrogenase [Citroniella saccharovorans]MEB3429102.1 nucleotide sugar dehydrogenase [Citroniella saccharovorans]
MSLKEVLLKKIEDKSLKVGVVGLGYVGLPLAVEKAIAGYETVGFDVQEEKVNMVNEGRNYIGDVVDEKLKDIVKRGKLRATSNFEDVASLDFIAIAVPTPLDLYQQPDISYVKKSTEDVSKHLKKGSIVVLESTTYPGTTEELMKPILEEGSGLKCGEDFFLAFSPERVDPGNKKYKTKNTPKVVGGVGEDATDVAAALYEAVLDADVMKVSSPKVAEMEKILENTYRNVNIGLVNEFAILADAMGINIWEVVDAAKTKPYGFQAFYPGPGVGGHCIPLDPFYLTWKAREYDIHMPLIEASGTINDKMPSYVVDRSLRILSKHFKKALNGSKVLILGIAYKADIDDLRDSPALVVIDEFEKEGAVLEYYDGFNPSYIDKNGEKVYSIKEINPEVLKQYDLVVITTAHTNVDYKMVVENSKFVFDTRYATKGIKADNLELL